VQFLRNVQRLLAEGLFVASYKYALIHALADLAVLKGDDTGAPLELTTQEIAVKFVELYWRQSRPFQARGSAPGLILQQNIGKQAAIISQIVELQEQCGASLIRLKKLAADRWSKLVTEVDQVVRTMPLWKLQTVGEERLTFLYENVNRGNRITLKPGVAYCPRAFYELLRDLIQGAWVRFVQKLNANQLGTLTDLGTVLFGQERTNLDVYRPILMDVQHGTCLYCRKHLSRQTQVDHFIPWSRYSADTSAVGLVSQASPPLRQWNQGLIASRSSANVRQIWPRSVSASRTPGPAWFSRPNRSVQVSSVSRL
jgi:hypothetical protein